MLPFIITLVLTLLEKTLSRLISILIDNLTKPICDAVRKAWLNLKIFCYQHVWTNENKQALLIMLVLSGLFLLNTTFSPRDLQIPSTNAYAGLVQDISYQTPGGLPTAIDRALWMPNGPVESGRMINLLMQDKCKDGRQYITYYAPRGCTLLIKLPDGSFAELNGDSKLVVPCDYGQDSREVELAGEAFFDICNNPNKVFTVHAEKQDITVLATSFNVNTYKENNYIQVSVLSGKVLVTARDLTSKSKQLKIVSADSCAIIDSRTGAITVDKFRRDVVIGWREGKYICHNKTYEEICIIAGRVFNQPIQIDNARIREWRLDATFYKRKSITHLVDLLMANSDSLYNYYDDQGTIHIDLKKYNGR